MGVDLRRVDVRMAQNLLNASHIGPLFEKVGGARMAQEMRGNGRIEAQLAVPSPEDLGDGTDLEAAPEGGDEEGRTPALQPGPGLAKIGVQGFESLGADRGQAALAALAPPDEKHPTGPVAVFEIQGAAFGPSDSRAVEGFEEGPIPEPDGVLPGRFEKPQQVLSARGDSEAGLQGPEFQGKGHVAQEELAVFEIGEEAPEDAPDVVKRRGAEMAVPLSEISIQKVFREPVGPLHFVRCAPGHEDAKDGSVDLQCGRGPASGLQEIQPGFGKAGKVLHHPFSLGW